MLRSLLFALLLCCVTAFAPPASLAVRPAVARAAGPMMKKTGGGGKSGGRNPTKDQVRRGKVRKMIFAADDAEKVSASLLGSDMEAMLIKMNWRVRHSMMKKIKNSAAVSRYTSRKTGAVLPCGWAIRSGNRLNNYTISIYSKYRLRHIVDKKLYAFQRNS